MFEKCDEVGSDLAEVVTAVDGAGRTVDSSCSFFF